MATAGPDVSVITPSTGRAAWVLGKLEALTRQTAGPDRIEVVLVDNACPARVGDVAEARRWPFRLRVLRVARRIPAAGARALAAAEARGRWLWWSDDDVVPDDDALERHLAVQARGDCVTIGAIRFVGEAGVVCWRPRHAGPAQLTGVNSLMPREALLRVAGDVMRLPRPYGGEDTAVGLALQASGLRFVDVRDAWVVHHGPPPSAAGDPHKGFDAGYNAAVIAARYPRAAWPLGVHALQLLAKRIAFSPWRRGVGWAHAPRWSRFEVAYLEGALAGRSHRDERAAPPPEVSP